MEQTGKGGVDVIIAAHNESATIAGPVRAALSAPSVRRVIVVDDCSTDDTSAVATAAGAEVIRRMGIGSKALAMQTGVRASSATTLFFCDADIIDLSGDHFEAILEPILSGDAVLSIGVIDYGALRNRLFLRLPPISGIRAMPRWVFESVPEEKVRGFQIEIMINEVVARRRMRFALQTLSGCRHRTKRDKVGLIRGWRSQFSMIGQLLACLTVVPLWTYKSFLDNLTIVDPSARTTGNVLLETKLEQEGVS